MVQSPRQLELYEKTVSVTMALENVLTAREISINYATCHLQGAKQYAGQLKSEMKCTQKRCRKQMPSRIRDVRSCEASVYGAFRTHGARTAAG